MITHHGGPRYLIVCKTEYTANATSYSERLSGWGLKIKRDSCVTVTSRARDLVMCAVLPLEFSVEKDDLAHIGFAEPLSVAGYRLAPPLSFGKSFSVEILLTAAASQVRYATILSNHPESKLSWNIIRNGRYQ